MYVRLAASPSNPNFSSHGPNQTTFGPFALLDRSRVALILAPVVAVLLFVGLHWVAIPLRPELFWITFIMGLFIGYLSQRRRSSRVKLQVGLSTVLPLAIAVFFALVSRDIEAKMASFAIIPGLLLGHLIARFIEGALGPRTKVRWARWKGVDRVGAAEQPGAVSFDIRALTGEGAPVTKKDEEAMRPRMGRSVFHERILVNKWVFLLLAPILTIAFIAGYVDGDLRARDDAASQILAYSLFVSIGIIGFWIMGWIGLRGSRYLTSARDHVVFARFAEANGFAYEAGPQPDGRFGREVSRVMRAEQERHWVIANAFRKDPISKDTTLNESSAAPTLFSGFCEFQLPVPLPNFLLTAKRMRLPEFSTHLAPDPDQKLSLEGNFDRHFTLYCPEGYGRDALYILTPDVMARLIDGARGFDIEFIDDRLVLRSRKNMVTRDPEQWQRIATAINALNDRVLQWSRWRDDRLETFNVGEGGHLVMDKPTGATKVGRRLRSALSLGAIVVLGYIGVYLGLLYVARELL